MKRKLLILTCLASALTLMSAVATAQESTPTPESMEPPTGGGQQPEVGVVFMDEAEGSGFDGVAVLMGMESETQIVVGLSGGGGGFLGFGGSDAESMGPAALLMGTCDEPGSVEEELGQLNEIMAPQQQGQQQEGEQQQEQETAGHAISASVQMSMDELISGGYIIGVLEQQQEGQQGQQEQEEQEISLLACGEVTEEAQLDGGMPTTPGAGEATPMPDSEGTPMPDMEETPTPETGS